MCRGCRQFNPPEEVTAAAAAGVQTLFQGGTLTGTIRRMDAENLQGYIWNMKYKIALAKTEEGYSVCVPGLPGCWSQGATEAEALANAKDAIMSYLAVAHEILQGAEIREIDIAG